MSTQNTGDVHINNEEPRDSGVELCSAYHRG